MPDRPSILGQWPLILAVVLLSTAFAFTFIASVDRAKSARSAELSLDTDGPHRVSEQGLTLTTRLGTLPPNSPPTQKARQPAPWWPAILFGLAFFCGWLFRNAARRSSAVMTPPVASGDEQTSVQSNVHRSENNEVLSQVDIRRANEEYSPDLGVNFPWDESALEQDTPLTSEERIERLEKQNASKAEVIKALERLVAENREKWLHQDETEARLDKHISDLSDDLRVAVRQLQQLQAGVTLPNSKAVKSNV